MSIAAPFVALAFVLSAIGAVILTRYTLQLKLLDVPNERSSHTNPTPRGGGIAIVATCTIGIALALLTGYLDLALGIVLLAGGLVVAVVGFVDDFKGVSTRTRLAIHFCVALLALSVMEGTSTLQIGNRNVELVGVWYVVAILGVIWTMNLFNFMDGIDGIAASESAFIALSGALISIPMAISTGVSVFAAMLAGSSLGFLRWNWQPARVFMGDVGSCYIGYVLAVLVLASSSQHSAAIWVWLVLGGGFSSMRRSHSFEDSRAVNASTTLIVSTPISGSRAASEAMQPLQRRLPYSTSSGFYRLRSCVPFSLNGQSTSRAAHYCRWSYLRWSRAQGEPSKPRSRR